MTNPTYAIHDKAGESYDVVVDDVDNCAILKVLDPSRQRFRVGHANLLNCGNGVVSIMEIMINQHALVPNRVPVLRWFKPRVEVAYREKGIGTALLQCAIRHANVMGASHLEIHQVRGFEGNAVDLVAWYSRHGFAAGPKGRLQLVIQ